MELMFNKDKVIKIFSNLEYRKKLDKIILNFFGLENNTIINSAENDTKESILEFMVFVNKIFLLKIVVKDTKKLFKTSKKFYINFSYKKSKKNYVLLYPCYWEFYCHSCLISNLRKKELETFAALFAATNIQKIKILLKELKIFNNKEVNDIINMIEES